MARARPRFLRRASVYGKLFIVVLSASQCVCRYRLQCLSQMARSTGTPSQVTSRCHEDQK